MNPGFPQLFEDHHDSLYFYEETNQHNQSGVYCVPLDYTNFHTICRCDGHKDIYFRFNLFLNLTNEVWKGRKGFLRLSTTNKEITLSVDEQTNLVITSGDVVMYRKKIIMGKLTAYELHVKSTEDEEVIELYINTQLAYTNKNKSWLYLNHETPLTIDCKNIIYIPNSKTKRHGIAFSSLILSNTRLHNAICALLDYTIDTDYEQQNDEFINGTTMSITPIIGTNDAIYAIEAACVPAYGKGVIEFDVNDNIVGAHTLSNIKCGIASDVMETYPATKAFWDNNNPIQIKAVNE